MTKFHYERVPGVKLDKKSVAYVNYHGGSNELCAKCVHYVNPTTCEIVAGKINPLGWCDRFEARAHEAEYGGSLHGAFRLPHKCDPGIRARRSRKPARLWPMICSATTWRSAAASFITLVVSHIGDGDINTGRRVLQKFVTALQASS